MAENVGITVVVPVGPQPEYKQYLAECFSSICEQMLSEDEIIVIDDRAGLSDTFIKSWGTKVRHYSNDWLLGCADSWNRGVALAKNDLCLLMGSDDRLYPDCLDEIREAYLAYNYLDAWYNLTIDITDGPDAGIHSVFNNAAAATRGLWRYLGGFPPSGFAAPDALAISILMVHAPERLIQVKEGTPLYWCRHHNAQDTPRQAGAFNQQVIDIRNIETARFVPNPDWARDL